VVDGVWTTDSELPLSEPNREGQVNNFIEVRNSFYPSLLEIMVLT
jgi:hypothetical protein